MKKNNRKKSPNRLTCAITGNTRMSNKSYIQAKADKLNISGEEWKLYYLSKEGYQQLVLEVEAGGLEFAANVLKKGKSSIIKMLRYNGRGKFVKVGATPPAHQEKEVAIAA